MTVWNRGDSTFDFRPGPVFANIVLADEINRASPKTQSALLEAMAEGQVTVDGVTYPLTPPFMVIATQNPIEHEGTYPLPESQLDRFLMRVSVGYPAPQAELEILDSHGDHDPFRDIGAVVSTADIEMMAAATRQVHVAPSLKAYLVDLADATRRAPTSPSACRLAPPWPPAGGQGPGRGRRPRLRHPRRRQGPGRAGPRPPPARDARGAAPGHHPRRRARRGPAVGSRPRRSLVDPRRRAAPC